MEIKKTWVISFQFLRDLFLSHSQIQVLSGSERADVVNERKKGFNLYYILSRKKSEKLLKMKNVENCV